VLPQGSGGVIPPPVCRTHREDNGVSVNCVVRALCVPEDSF
jgi:hypothetical protein